MWRIYYYYYHQHHHILYWALLPHAYLSFRSWRAMKKRLKLKREVYDTPLVTCAVPATISEDLHTPLVVCAAPATISEDLHVLRILHFS